MDSKAGLDALFLFATEGILVMNESGEIIRINPSAEKLFGYEPGELLGKKIEVLVPKRFAGMHHSHREKYNEHPRARYMGVGLELFGLKKDGTEFPVEISLSPYSAEGEKFVIAFIVDITLRWQAEENLRNYSAELEKQVKNRTLVLEEAIDELEKTKMELNEALAKERELGEMKSRFVSMASHEFRTPLATILSSLNLVKTYGDINDKEKRDKHISRIKSSINTLTGILNDFLSVSKIEEGKIENVPEPLKLDEFITAVIHEVHPISKVKQNFIYRHSGGVDVVLDKKLLKHILLNLLSNAIKFSEEGESISVVSECTPGQVLISVHDNGIGIPEEDQQHLFERFFRSNNATHVQGTGLGLSIVARYTELMGGTIKLVSGENEGTEFMLTFPQ